MLTSLPALPLTGLPAFPFPLVFDTSKFVASGCRWSNSHKSSCSWMSCNTPGAFNEEPVRRCTQSAKTHTPFSDSASSTPAEQMRVATHDKCVWPICVERACVAHSRHTHESLQESHTQVHTHTLRMHIRANIYATKLDIY